MSDTEETKPKGPAISTLENEQEKLDAMLALRKWLSELNWPDYVGTIHMRVWSSISIGPTDPAVGFPEHFAVDMLKLLPLGDKGLKREFSEMSGNIYWNGYLDNDKLPEDLGKALNSAFSRIGLTFICGQKTDCVLTSKEVTREIKETVWSMDCSGKSEAKAEVV